MKHLGHFFLGHRNVTPTKLKLIVLFFGLLLSHGMPARSEQATESSRGWFKFDPEPDKFTREALLDLRYLNESYAGENGFVRVKDGGFVHAENGAPVRFWGVNGPPHDLKGESLRRCARTLAKHGVNLVRIHGGYFDKNGQVDEEKIRHAIEIVEAMKGEGIYSHFSIYFPLWFKPEPGNPWLKGYDGNTHPFAALFFNSGFQAQYRKWWVALLTTPSPKTGKTLFEEPAIFALEIQNEDSFFFWTFAEKNLPEEQWRILEELFGDWLSEKYGSIENAFSEWKGQSVKRDAPADGRVGFRPLWNIFNEKSPRDQDTTRFLFEMQTRFYAETARFLRTLGYKGLITASNWTTASPVVFGPLEKLSYTIGDFLDRHGYFGAFHKGDSAAWSIRNGHTYRDRSALRFDAEVPEKPRQFVHPAMDVHYEGKPSMISETTWNRPNRYRSEAPLYYAVYGALQHTDAIVHFALDGDEWRVKPRFFMQPWTLMTPDMMGQFPAAALIFRRGFVSVGDALAEVNLNKEDLLRLKGTPMPESAALDELRLQDVPKTSKDLKPGMRLDPRMHLAGRVNVRFTEGTTAVTLRDLDPFIDHDGRIIKSSTGELLLNYRDGVLLINSARAQGISGHLTKAGRVETEDLVVSSTMDLGHIVVVALDGKPLGVSGRMLLQVMSEEMASGFQIESASGTVKRIKNIGTDPWLVKEIRGSLSFNREDADHLRVKALDFNGYPVRDIGAADKITLLPDAIYYLIQ